MLSDIADDKLALGFDAHDKAYVNIGMDVSSIDVNAISCGLGHPVGISNAIFLVSLIDSPDGVVRLDGNVLDLANVSSPEAANQWTFNWTYNIIALDARKSENGNLSVVWDLVEGGYATFDNLIVVASNIPGSLGCCN